MKRIKLGGKRGGYVMVDDADFDMLSAHAWSQDHHGYPCARVDGRPQWMHWLLLKAPSGLLTDHINRNKLDNRRSNLRIVDYSMNARNVLKSNNKLGTRGVHYDKRTGKFCAAAHIHGRRVWGGRHATKQQAVAAYGRITA